MAKKRSGTGDGGRWVQHAVSPDEAGTSVEELLVASLGVSRRMIQRLTRSQGILLNGRSPRLSGRVKEGDSLAVRIAAREEPGLVPVEMPLQIVYEDADVLVVDKPPFLLVHPVNPKQTRTLAHGIAHHFAQTGVRARVRPLHRLDRDTSGLVVIAKTEFAHQHLDRQLRQGTLRREYIAFVEGRLEGDGGLITASIGRLAGSPHLRAVRTDGESALTRYRVLAGSDEMTMLELQLETGRTHQIRVHLAHLGHPVVGDRQYGARQPTPLRRQALHAHRIGFNHPMTGEVRLFEAGIPEDLAPLARALQPDRDVRGSFARERS
jgi:23S rRNA pseudouridine1911/1915/1917 synthase